MASAAETTPSQRLGIESKTKLAACKRATAADPHGGRCLISGSHVRQHCHVVPRTLLKKSTSKHILDRLEWYWRMRHLTLNLDSRYNIVLLQPTLHTEYDKGFFVLIPALCYLEQYLATIDQSGYTTREAFPEIEGTVFDYHFVPISYEIEKEAIICVNYDGVSETEEVARFPFRNIPVLKSHIHPRFAIVQAGHMFRKLDDAPFAIMKRASEAGYAEHFAAVEKIYGAWTSPIRANSENHASYKPVSSTKVVEDDDDDDDDDDYLPEDADRDLDDQGDTTEYLQTEPTRSQATKRKSDGRGDGSPRSKKPRASKSTGFRSKQLALHTRTVGKRKWESDSISEWARESYACKPRLDCQDRREPFPGGFCGGKTLVSVPQATPGFSPP